MTISAPPSQAFVNVVGRSVDQLEETISNAEKELDPSKLRKMFTAFVSSVAKYK